MLWQCGWLEYNDCPLYGGMLTIPRTVGQYEWRGRRGSPATYDVMSVAVPVARANCIATKIEYLINPLEQSNWAN